MSRLKTLRISYMHNVSAELVEGRTNCYVPVAVSLCCDTYKPELSTAYCIPDLKEIAGLVKELDALRVEIRHSARDLAETMAKELQDSTTIINSDGSLITLVA